MSEIDNFLNDDQPARKGSSKSEVDAFLEDSPPPARGFGGWARDIAATAVKGAIAVPEAVVGLADIPTGGRVGKFLENEGGTLGFRPKQAKEAVNEWHSDATKAAQQKFQEAEGFGGKFKAAIENPSVIASAIGESIPSMAAGGVAARGLMAATRLGRMGEIAAARGASVAEQAAAAKKGAAIAAAVGEGALMAGSQAENIRQETEDGLLTPTQAGLAAATGVVGGAFGVAGNRLAQRLGVGDVDTMIAQGATGSQAQQAALKSIPRQVIQGAMAEGLLEELPQSVSEQILQNMALGKDWSEGVDAAAVMGVLSGGAMGGAAAGVQGFANARRPAERDPQEPPAVTPTSQEPTAPQSAEPAPRLGFNPLAGTPTIYPDGSVALNGEQEFQYRTGSVAPQKRSEQMGLNPSAGPMSSAAALAVDTGASDQVQEQAALAMAAEEKTGKPAASDPVPLEQRSLDELRQAFRGAQDPGIRQKLAAEIRKRREAMPDPLSQPQQEVALEPQAPEAVQSQPQEAKAAAELGQPLTDTGTNMLGRGADPLQPIIQSQADASRAAVKPPRGILAKKAAADAKRKKANEQAAQPAVTSAETAADPAPAVRGAGVSGSDQPGAMEALSDEQNAPQATTGAPVTTGAATTGAETQATQAPAPARGYGSAAAGVPGAGAGSGVLVDGVKVNKQAGPESVRLVVRRDIVGDKFELQGKSGDGEWEKQTTFGTDADAKSALKSMGYDADSVETLVSDWNAKAKRFSPPKPAPTGAGDVQADEVKIAEAANQAATSPKNDLPQPTEAQKDAGNYVKGHVTINGLGISIENPAGSKRRPEWPALKNHYGYFKGSVGADKDHVDVFMTDRAGDESLPVFVVDQVNKDGTFDEHKVVMGAADEAEARATYLQNYEKGWTGLGAITQMSQEDFKTWVRDPAKTKKPVALKRGVLAKMADQKRQAALDRIAKGTAYFGTKAKADEFITKSGIGDTHEVVQAKAGRFEIRSKVASGMQTADASNAEQDAVNRKAMNWLLRTAMPDERAEIEAAVSQPKPGKQPETVNADAMTRAEALQALEDGKVLSRFGDQVWIEKTTAGKVETYVVKSRDADSTAVFTKGPVGPDRQWGWGRGDAAREAVQSWDFKPAQEVSPLVQAMNDLADVRSRIAQQGQVVDDRLLQRERQLKAVVKELEANGQNDELDSEMQAYERKAKATKAPAAPAPAKPDHLTEKEKAAKAKMLGAAAKLADLLSKNTRANITPEQEQKMLPIVIELFEGAMDLGYVKFKQAARYVREFIAGAIDQDAADSIPIDTLQGAYIATARRHADKDITPKKDVITVESIADLEEPAESADTGAPKDGNATQQLDRTGTGALGGAPTQDVRAPDGDWDAGAGADRGGRGDGAGNARADDAGGNAGRGLGGDAGAVSVPGRGTRAGAADAKKPRVSRTRRADPGDGLFGPAGGLTPEVGANPAPNAPAIPAPQPAAQDFTITDELSLGEGGQKTKFRNNVAAIRLVRDLEATGRMATPEEQAVLAKYVGWGGLPQAFDPNNADWAREHAELTELMSPEDLADARKSTRYAHYTSREIIVDGIYAALRRFGFNGGKTLEAGAGVGNFIGLMPADMRSAGRFTAIEREPFSSAIARNLYPQQSVQRADFTEFKGTDAYYDAAVGNPPFASDPQTDRSGRKHLSGLSLHNYFFAKAIDMLREGGIMAQVVTNSFLDAKGDRARKYISDRAEFLGAIRLPNNAFSKNAGTDVTTDIIFLKKRPDSEVGGKAARADAKRWLDIGTYTDKNGKQVALNQYFIDNPDMMLGEFGAFGTMYGPEKPALVAHQGQDTMALLKAAVERLPAGVYKSIAETGTANQINAAVVALKNPSVKEGGYFLDGDKLMQRIEDIAGEARGIEITPATQWTAKTVLGDAGYDRIKRLAGMRSTVRSLLAAEMADDTKAMETLRATLNQQYDAYRDTHGLINDLGTLRVFDDDPDYPLLASLEHGYTPGISVVVAKRMGVKPTKATAKKGPIFTQRVVAARQAVQKVETPADALAVSMAERGKLDAAYIGQLLGMDPDAVLKELSTGDKPLLFLDPATDEYVLRDAYLSGNVRAKLAQAREAGMFQNVAELEAVQPEDVGSHEITARLGSPWVPTDIYRDFAKNLYGEDSRAVVVYQPANSSYQVFVSNGSEVALTNTWGTRDYPGDALLQAVMNNRSVKVTYRDSEGKTHTDIKATEEANEKAQQIKEKFNDWLFADPERSEILTKAYNETNNNYVTRVYDGSHMTFPGKVPDSVIKFRRHQRNAIARIVQDRTALLDHVVGAGKTFTVISGAMELKRTGLARKPMVAVPNHLVKQWAADFYRLYPGANVLTATKKDFEKGNRRKFLAKIATGDWDAVVIAHSSFGFIKPAPEFEAEFNGREIQKIMATIQNVEYSDGEKQTKKRTIKQLEGMKERLENRIRQLRDKPMDDLLDFEQIGVDQLFVDEAHLFKNLMYTTKMQGVAGLNDPTGSQRAYDMYVKTNHVMEKNGRGQGVVFATGTPVSNSLAEMYHMMRYLMPNQMRELGFDSFDAWANTYASVEQVWMQAPSGDGFKAQNRMSNFVNTPELLKMFDQVSDTVTMDDIKRAYAEENEGAEFPLPKLKGGRRTPVSLIKSPAQDAYMAEIAKRAQAIEKRKGPPQKGDDNILVVMSDARKAAMDIRLAAQHGKIGETGDFNIDVREKGGRIDVSTDAVVERYKKFDSVKGTQLVFSDLGTPIKHAKKELSEYEALQARIQSATEDVVASAALGNEAAIETLEDAEAAQAELDAMGPDWLSAVKAALRGFSIYDDFKAALVEKGIPEEEIAFIHDYNTDDQKASLFRKVNAGQIRVLLGSTAKLGAGTNVQERLVALHHLDVPWRPSDVEQREGRIERQGNRLMTEWPNFEIEILAYVTQDTLDMRMWQVQETKLKMINQLRTRKIGREIDNAFEDMELSAGEMQAAATGDINLLKEIQLRNDVKKLEQRRRAFDGQRNDLISRKRRNAEALRVLPAKVAESKAEADVVRQYREDVVNSRPAFRMNIDGKDYTDAAEAQGVLRALDEATEEVTDLAGEVKTKKKPLSVTIDGELIKNRATMAELYSNATGDKDPIAWTYNGETYRRRTVLANAIRAKVQDAIADDSLQQVGTIGAYSVAVEGNGGDVLEVTLSRGGDVKMSNTMTASDTGRAADKVVTLVENLMSSALTEAGWLERSLERAKKDADELSKVDVGGDWPDQAKLDAARAAHKEVLATLKKKEEAAAPATEDEDDAFMGEAEAPIFYSALRREIEGLSTKTAPAVGWNMALQGLVKNGKVKSDELEWTGISEWLKLQTGKVSKEDVLAYLDANGVQVTETVLQGASDYVDYDTGEVYPTSGVDNPTKYGQYTLPGGENYREVLLTLPHGLTATERAEADALSKKRDKAARSAAGISPKNHPPLTTAEAKRLEELAAKSKAPSYRAGHWDQPNVLAHIRVNDRVDADGKRVLFVEEIQSDWGQDGKKKGFSRPNDQKRADELLAKQDSGQRLTDEEKAEARALSSRIISPIPAAPFVDKTDKWLALSLKRIMKMAVDGGYDAVAFVTGDQSAERYDLSKQISEINYEPAGEGLYEINAKDMSGKTVLDEDEVTLARIEELVGKEIAKKIEAGEGEKSEGGYRDWHKLSGLDLKVGGEGMKAFYDKIVPAAVKDVLKKVGGGQMEMVGIDQTDERTAGPDEITWAQQPGFTITDSMREKVAGGLPLFAGSKSKARGTGTPIDRAVMSMAADGKSGNDILQFIANASRSPYRRQLAKKLLATGANPAVTIGGDMGSKDGYKNLAFYSRKNHEIVMSEEAVYKAEQIFLHEAIHSATLLALDKQTLFGVQMKKLYESVQDQGLSDTYGMKNIGEFVAEAFTNPQFQKALRNYKAPKKEAADMSLWERFVSIVRKILRMEPREQDALSAALDLGAKVMRENMPLRAARSFRAEDGPAFAGIDQTETPEFKRWFGNSAVVDPAGKPLVVYHGTKAKFTAFDRKKSSSGLFGTGFYFTDDRKMAEEYADGGQVMEVYLSIKNPAPQKVANEVIDLIGEDDADGIRAELERRGYDGVLMTQYGETLAVAFSPEQIKSATGNRGTFDPNDPDIAHFGIADAVEQIGKQAAVKPVVQALNDTFKVRGKLHWWHKTVGTPFNLAERVPEFKRVFNAVQDFINSVSFYGAEAAAMAPKIIPKLESWKDLGKSPIKAEDNKAIAAPIFEGTLAWMRDESGKPVKVADMQAAADKLSADDKAQRLLRARKISPEVLAMWRGLPLEQFQSNIETRYTSEMLRPGVVWSDSELRSLFKLNDGQIGLYREFRAATDKSLTDLAMSDILQFAGKDADPIKDQVMGMNLTEGSETVRDYLLSLADSDPDRRSDLIDTANAVIDKANRVQDLMDSGYAPLQRFGRFTVYAKDADGEQLFFGMYEDRWAAARAARQMREQYPDASIETGMMSQEAYKLFQGISPETLEIFGTMLGMDSQADGETNKAFQTYLKLAKSNRSALKRLIERKGISGYSEDASRVLASFIYSNARQTASNLHVGEIMNGVNDIPRDMGDAKDAAMRLARYTMDPQEEAQAIRGLLFAQYLGGSIASAAINALQPAQVTFPYLSQFVGAKKSAVLMKDAVRDALKKKTGDVRLDAELKKAEEEGIVSPQEIFQLMAQAQGKATLRAGDGTKAGDAAALASNTLSRVSLGWGKVFSIPEQFNRRTTFIAAYRTALETGEANPYDFAKQAVKETQLVYNKGNRPEWARGSIGALAFTFKTYSISYVELLQRMATSGPEGRRAAMLMLGVLFLMAGAGGAPGVEDLEDVVDGIAQRVFGLNFQSRQKRQEWLAETFGEGAARFIENGVSGLPWSPTDVSGRLGLGNLIPGTGLFVKKENYGRDVAEIAGPAADMTKRFLEGAGLLLQGEVLKAGEIVSPVAVRNMIQGGRMLATDQYTDTKGRKVIDTTTAEGITKLIGFQPADVARVQEATGTTQRMIVLNKIRESEIADKWAKGLASGDADLVQEARDELARWNKANPESQIRIKIPQIMRRVRALKEDKATRIARTAPAEIRQDVRRALEQGQ